MSTAAWPERSAHDVLVRHARGVGGGGAFKPTVAGWCYRRLAFGVSVELLSLLREILDSSCRRTLVCYYTSTMRPRWIWAIELNLLHFLSAWERLGTSVERTFRCLRGYTPRAPQRLHHGCDASPFTLPASGSRLALPPARANISAAKPNPLRAQCLKELKVGDETYHYYSLPALQDARVGAY